jgi:hypothetical protein
MPRQANTTALQTRIAAAHTVQSAGRSVYASGQAARVHVDRRRGRCLVSEHDPEPTTIERD